MAAAPVRLPTSLLERQTKMARRAEGPTRGPGAIMNLSRERRYGTSDSEQFSSGSTDSLSSAEDRVKRARELSEQLFREVKRTPQYKLVLANKGRMDEFREETLKKAHFINRKLYAPLRDADVEDVTNRLVGRVAEWEHSPARQRARQQKQVEKRRRRTRGRDLRILRLYEEGMSPAKIAESSGHEQEWGASRSGEGRAGKGWKPCCMSVAVRRRARGKVAVCVWRFTSAGVAVRRRARRRIVAVCRTTGGGLRTAVYLTRVAVRRRARAGGKWRFAVYLAL